MSSKTFLFFFVVLAAQMSAVCSVYAQTLQVGVGTSSALKVEAVKAALKTAFPGQDIHVHSFKAPSHIADQPVSEKWGVQGARNRIASAKQMAHGQPIDIWISMENYIEETPHGWIDRAAVVVENIHPEVQVLKFSASIPFDEKFAREARERSQRLGTISKSGFSITSGEVIHDHYLKEKGVNLPKDNWHGHKDFGGTPREVLLEEAIEEGLKELIPIWFATSLTEKMKIVQRISTDQSDRDQSASDQKEKPSDELSGVESQGKKKNVETHSSVAR